MLMSSGKIQKKYGVCRVTLRQWAKDGLIKSYSTPKGHYRYFEADIRRVLGINEDSPV